MLRSALLPVCAVLLTGCAHAGAWTAGVQGEDSFATDSLHQYEQASEGTAGSWQVSGGRLTATGPAIQSVLVRRDPGFADGYVEAVATRADDGGLVLRYTSERAYYLLAFRDDAAPHPRGELNLALYRRVGDRFAEMAQQDVRWARGTARTIRFQADGAVLRAFVDGEPVLEVTDPRPLSGGRVGLRHYGADKRWITTFDAFRWREAAE